MAFIPSLTTAISSARPEETGVAAGLVNTSYQIGSAMGLAALIAVAAAFTGPTGDAVALTDGNSAAFVGAAVIAFVGAAVTAIALRPTALVVHEPVMAEAAA